MLATDAKIGEGVSLPGGTLVSQRPETPLSIVATELDLAHGVKMMCKDPDFHEQFVLRIPDKSLQRKYLINTSRYLNSGDTSKEPFDPEFVLVFRRALPSTEPKPEAHWTTEFKTARRGLRLEIPEGPHRHHSIVLCATLAEILKVGLAEKQNAAQSDGEIKIKSDPFSRDRILFSFKPEAEIRARETYLLSPDALDLEATLRVVAERVAFLGL